MKGCCAEKTGTSNMSELIVPTTAETETVQTALLVIALETSHVRLVLDD